RLTEALLGVQVEGRQHTAAVVAETVGLDLPGTRANAVGDAERVEHAHAVGPEAESAAHTVAAWVRLEHRRRDTRSLQEHAQRRAGHATTNNQYGTNSVRCHEHC